MFIPFVPVILLLGICPEKIISNAEKVLRTKCLCLLQLFIIAKKEKEKGMS